MYRIELIRSRDNGGWYAEVYVRATGRTVHQTEVYPDKAQARAAGRGPVVDHTHRLRSGRVTEWSGGARAGRGGRG